MKLGFLIKSKFIKRTGSPGNYNYTYTEKKGRIGLNNIDLAGIEKLKKDPEFLNSFMKDNQAFVRNITTKLLEEVANVDDAIQEANIGFIKAVKKFSKKDPKGFLSYVKVTMLNAIKDKIRTDLKKDIKSISIDETITGSDRTREETIVDPRVEAEFENREVKSLLSKIGSEIKSTKNRKIFEYMVKGYNQGTIAKIMKMSKGRVSQIVKQEIRPIAEKYKDSFNKSMAFTEVIKILNSFLEE